MGEMEAAELVETLRQLMLRLRDDKEEEARSMMEEMSKKHKLLGILVRNSGLRSKILGELTSTDSTTSVNIATPTTKKKGAERPRSENKDRDYSSKCVEEE
jgi:hypothetical protein